MQSITGCLQYIFMIRYRNYVMHYVLSATQYDPKIMQCITGCLQHHTIQKLCNALQAVCNTIPYRNYAMHHRLSATPYRNYAKHYRLSATQYDPKIMQCITGCLQHHTIQKLCNALQGVCNIIRYRNYAMYYRLSPK